MMSRLPRDEDPQQAGATRDRQDSSEVHTLAGAYALDALDDVERVRFDRHLAECDDCVVEVASFHETAALLGTGATLAPPPGLRERVLAEAAQTRQLSPVQPPRALERSGSRAVRLLAVAASSLLVLTLGLGAVALSWRSDADRARQVAAGMSEVLADPERQVVDAEFGSGHGTLVVSGDRVVVLGDDVEAPPAGKAFQLWLIGDEGPRPSVMLEPTGDGNYWAATTGVRDGDEFGVTIEDDGGATVPSDELVLVTSQA